MIVYLANAPAKHCDDIVMSGKCAFLESYYAMRKGAGKLFRYYRDFLLDSGTFSFLRKGSLGIDFDAYLEEYAHFVKEHNIGRFFELDIYDIVGVKKTEQLRTRLEKITGKQPIVVWHNCLARSYFVDMCKNYPYVAIGGMASGHISRRHFADFPKFINLAHEYGAKIHGLGFINMKWLPLCHFDSVDSTSWQNGARYGFQYDFNGKGFNQFVAVHNGKKVKDRIGLMRHNLLEWLKFQAWARNHL